MRRASLRSSRAAGWFGTCLMAAAVVGCSTSSVPGQATESPAAQSVPGSGPLATTEPGSDPSVTATSGGTGQPSSAVPEAGAVPEAVANMPAAARVRSGKGAEAFVSYYMALTNDIGTNPRLGVLAPLSTTACKSCAGAERRIRQLIDRKKRYSGPQLTILAVNGWDGIPEKDPEYLVGVHARQGGYPIVAADTGEVLQQVPPEEGIVVMHLVWTSSGWKTDKIKMLEGSRH